jgi:hypothetical protein
LGKEKVRGMVHDYACKATARIIIDINESNHFEFVILMKNSDILIQRKEDMPVSLKYFSHNTVHIFTVDLD